MTSKEEGTEETREMGKAGKGRENKKRNRRRDPQKLIPGYGTAHLLHL